MSLPKETQRYTFSDLLSRYEQDRAELIAGQVVMMPPPSRVNQEISGELYRQFANYLEGKFMPLPSLSAYSNRRAIRLRL